MLERTVEIELNGRSYTWDGEGWYETKTFAVPPTGIVPHLYAALAQLQEQTN